MKEPDRLLSVVLGVAAIWSLVVEGLPVRIAMVMLVTVVFLGVFAFVPWQHEKWTRPITGGDGARAFYRMVRGLTLSAKSVLVLLALMCGLTGTAIRHGPAWASTAVRDIMIAELPQTHPDISVHEPTDSLLKIVNPERQKKPDAFVAVHSSDGIRFESLSSVSEEAIRGIEQPLLAGSPAVWFLCVAVGVVVAVSERIGAKTYGIVV